MNKTALKDRLKNFFAKYAYPISIFLFAGLAFEIGHSNLNSIDIYTTYFFIPLILSVVIWKIWQKKLTEKFGSPAFVMIHLFLIGLILLPLGNRLYVRKQFEFKNLPVIGMDADEGWKAKHSDTYQATSHVLVVENPLPSGLSDYQSIGSSIRVPVSRSTVKKCKVGECALSFHLKLGLFNKFYVSDVDYSGITKH